MTTSKFSKKEAEQVFDKWRASLINKPKGHKNLTENFDELFFDLNRLELSYDDAYEYLQQAYVAHYPSKQTVKHQYKSSTWAKNFDSETEFAKNWQSFIKDKATTAFHEYYDLPFTDQKTPQDVKREKARAKNSAAIRDYMEKFEPVDIHALRAKIASEKLRLETEDSTDDLLNDLELNNG